LLNAAYDPFAKKSKCAINATYSTEVGWGRSEGERGRERKRGSEEREVGRGPPLP